MISATDYYRKENVDANTCRIRVFIASNSEWSIPSYKWLYLTEEFPTNIVENAKIYTLDEATEFFNGIESKSENVAPVLEEEQE